MANTKGRVKCARCGAYRDRTEGRGKCPWCALHFGWLLNDYRYETPLATVRRLVELRRRADQGLPLFGGPPLPR